MEYCPNCNKKFSFKEQLTSLSIEKVLTCSSCNSEYRIIDDKHLKTSAIFSVGISTIITYMLLSDIRPYVFMFVLYMVVYWSIYFIILFSVREDIVYEELKAQETL